MTRFFEQIVSKLSEHTWSNLTESHSLIESLLEKLKSERDLLRDEFKAHSPIERLSTALASREPTTHFKWLIFRDPGFRFEVWLHEYKSKELLRPGYAVVPHNHVYQFSSLILTGGFRHIAYKVSRSSQDETSFDDIRVSAETSLNRNMIYTLTSDEVHSLAEIQEGTITLVINSASNRTFSEEFNMQSRRVIKHYPLPVRVKTSYPFLDQI